MSEDELGPVRGTYPTNNRRRGSVAAILLSVGVPLTALAVVFWVIIEDASGKTPQTGGDPLLFPTVVVGLGVGMLFMGAWAGIWYLTHRGEVFEVHDNGLRYSRAGRTKNIPWTDVDRVSIRDGKDTALARWVGGDVSCTIYLSGGGKLTITGLTEGARQLVRHVETATTWP